MVTTTSTNHHLNDPTRQQQQQQQQQQQHRVAGLSCERYGGPPTSSIQELEEMIYWKDVPSDAQYVSPFLDPTLHPENHNHRTTTTTQTQHPQPQYSYHYLTFEPDEGGWNNIRMAMETAVALAISMGRILVVPPKMKFYRLWDGGSSSDPTRHRQRNILSFTDFYHLTSIQQEHTNGLQVITFQEFLEREAMTGQLYHRTTGTVSFPPENRTDWSDGALVNYDATLPGPSKVLWEWIRQVTQPLDWSYDQCVAVFPVGTGSRRGTADGILFPPSVGSRYRSIP
jgi:GDP-fucose protein O-fucosyltransferase